MTRKEGLACAPDEILQPFIDDAGSQLQLRLGAVVVASADVYDNPDASLVPICRDGKHGSGHNVGSASVNVAMVWCASSDAINWTFIFCIFKLPPLWST